MWWPFTLLCLLQSSRWMLSDAMPGAATTFGSAALGCGSIAALYLLIVRPSARLRNSGAQLARVVLAGALVLAGPSIVLLRPGLVPAESLTMALALTPVVLAVAETAVRHTQTSLAGRLWPGLAAVAGLLLLLAQPSLSNPGMDILLALALLLSGCGAVLFCSTRPTAWRIPAALLGGCAVLALGAAVNHLTHAGGGGAEMQGLAAGLDAAEALLSLLTLSRISATRWSAQFALAPLLTLLEGIALMRSWIPARMIVGLLLLAAASIALLVPPPEEISLDLGASRPTPTVSD
jgi:drug/metabolite transporter (DMT)-like permease